MIGITERPKKTQEENNPKLDTEFFTFSVMDDQNSPWRQVTLHGLLHYRSISDIATKTLSLQTYFVTAIYDVFEV
jgi:hypothetical protein